MIQVGLGVQTDAPVRTLQTVAVQAEEVGFDVLSVYNDLGYGPALPALMAMALVTRRIELGPAAVTPATMAPHEIAGAIAMLDDASGGRARLGLARGAWMGAVGREPASIAAIVDTIEVVDRILSGRGGAYHGTVESLGDDYVRRFPVVRPRVPIMVGTWGPQLARRVCGLADEIKVGGSANPAMVTRILQVVGRPDPGGPTAGGPPSTPDVVLGAVTVVDADGAAARARARREVAMYVDVVATLDPAVTVDPDARARLRAAVAAGDAEAAAGTISDDLLDAFAFAGTPDQVAERAHAIMQAGATRVEFGIPYGLTTADGIALLGREVLPRLRGSG